MTKKKARASSLRVPASIMERVTRTEERIVAIDKVQIEWRDETRAAHKDLGDRLEALEKALHKYQGAWGFLTLILSALGAAFAMFHEAILKKLGLGGS